MPSDAWSTVITTVLARVRDPDGAVHSTALCQDLLTRLQRLYNNQLRLVISEMPVSTLPGQQLYPLTEPLGIHIVKVTHQNRPLDRLTFSQLRALDPRWPRATGSRLEGFMQLGYTFLLLWPALFVADTVLVTATKLTTDLTTGPATLDIPSQATPKLAQLLELL